MPKRLGLLILITIAALHGRCEDVDSEEISGEEADDDGRIYKNPRNSPSAFCPRDEELAELLKHKCLRKCSTDEDCKSKKKKCLCDGACGMSCIKPERECEELASPSFGEVSLSGRLFGDLATYTCENGYHIVGLAERVCQADGNWSGQNTLCKHNIFCRGPPQLEHARHSAPPKQVTFDVDTALEYRCHHGYDTDGFPQAKCLYIDGTASWYGPDISCHPRSCGTPDDIAHGWHAGECYTYGCRVSYHCAEGFELVGRKERLCQPDGQWNPHELPSCVLVTAVECPTPEHPANGKAIYTSTSYNSVVTYECKYGFTLAGEATRRCGADRKWSGHQPQCKEINCGHPGVLHNGWIENVEAGFGLGASLIFRCQDGMLLLGNSSSVCQVDGTWRYPPPQCLAPCVVPGVQHGRVELMTRGVNGTSASLLAAAASAVVPHGERLSVRCNQSYEFLLASTPVACNNGTWTHMPRCEPARCKKLPKAPRNGMVIAPKNDHGMQAKFQCRDGYTLRGTDTNVCQFGNWTGDLPFCQEVYCPFPGYLEYGKVMLVGNMGLYDYRPYVRKVTNNKQIMYDCDKGFVLEGGPPGATCIGGQWSPKELPKCVPGLHPRIRWSRSLRSKRALMMGNHHQRTHQTLITRQRGRRPGKGRGAGQNRKDRNQKGKATPCDVITNEAFATVDIVKVGKNSNQTYSPGTVVRLICGEGYHTNLEHKNSTARCTARGVWKPIKPECLIIPCRIPESEHGIFILSHLEAEEEMSESLSSLSAPPIPEDPAEPRFGDILEFNSSVKNGQLVEFSCRPGFKVKGVAHLKCWHGRWQSPEPSCSPAPCELPIVPGGQYLGGYRAGLTIADGSSVHFQCENDSTGGSALPPLPVECVLGELRPFNPECGQNRSLLYRLAEDLEFKGGSDITKGGIMSVSKLSPGMRRSCGPPARVQGSLIYRDGQPIHDSERSFPDRTEVTFNCIASFMGEKTTWRIVCEDGSWVGRSLNCDGEDLLDSGHQGISSRNATCRFRNSEPNVVSFYNDQQITEDVVEFPPGSILVSRCVDIGKYALIGARSRRCINGDWDGQKPVCFGLNQENDYALEKPPTILFRHQLGPIAQSNDGKLVVYPGTILHMECLWIRRFGTPKWNISHEYSQEGVDEAAVSRKYPEGWTTDPGRDSQLEYRLSIYHASKDDSGLFTCITPTRHTHAVEIEVQAVHCPTVPSRRGLILSSTSTKMNIRVLLSCANGNSLIGAPELTCLPSGNWSAPVPICESIECADLVNLTDPHLRVSILSREVGGRAVFSCAQGFGLNGPNDAVCQQNGDWSMPLPTCQEVQCETPPTPENGYIQGSGPYKAGDVVQFNCNPEFMMDGQPIVACQENGRWSRVVPKCVPACSYPGTTISGRMSAVKFYYHIGETITFTCDPGLALRGAHKLRCLRNGKWSNAIPTCIPPDSTSPEGTEEEEKKEDERGERERDRDRERAERARERERRRKVPVEVEATSR